MRKLFQLPQSWAEKVYEADNIWSQVRAVLSANNEKMPQTLRRPDVRMIINNTSGLNRTFRNPANHANDKNEMIPASGDKTAVMVMLNGDTLKEQHENAQHLFDKFSLGENGLSDDFVKALADNAADGLVQEAYGPAPFADQSSKLLPLDWVDVNGTHTSITPLFGKAASIGARPATHETAFLTHINLYIKGSHTTPELVESAGMVIKTRTDKDRGDVTDPVVASVAKEFYGAHFNTLPLVVVHPSGYVTSIDLRDGRVFELATNSDQFRQGLSGPA